MAGKRKAGANAHADPASGVQSYFIYGFDRRDFDQRFLHFERIEEQLPYHNWSARPHLHDGLHQTMFFSSGGGEMLIEDRWLAFKAPALVFVPAGVVHGFRFARDTAGPIVTVSQDFMAEVLGFVETDIAGVTHRPILAPLDASQIDQHEIDGLFRGIARDYSSAMRGRGTAFIASLALLLVALARVCDESLDPRHEAGAYPEIFRAFQQRIEQTFRKQPSIAEIAADLGLTPGRLTMVCRAMAQRSPQQLLHMRLVAEAKRQLLYSSHAAANVAYALGFRDPGYFSRFFKRETGMSPIEFRRNQPAPPMA